MPIHSKFFSLLSAPALIRVGLCTFSGLEVNANEKQSHEASRAGASMAPLYGFRLPDIDGRPVDLKTSRAKRS